MPSRRSLLVGVIINLLAASGLIGLLIFVMI